MLNTLQNVLHFFLSLVDGRKLIVIESNKITKRQSIVTLYVARGKLLVEVVDLCLQPIGVPSRIFHSHTPKIEDSTKATLNS